MNTNDTTLAAWRMAVRTRAVKKGLIFHSDQGVQYATKKFANTIESYGIIRSMSTEGNCWDNALTESLFKSLKTELIYENKLISKEQMKLEIFDPSDSQLAKQYIEICYNRKKNKR